MTTDLALLGSLGLLATTTEEANALAAVTEATTYLPRIQLITKGKYVDTGKIAPGHWGVPQAGGEEIQDLGESIDVLVLKGRPKAMDVSDRDAIVTTYDPSDPEFIRIREAPKDTGCMWGPTYLVFERNTGSFYELFFYNASMRAEAPKLQPFLPKEDGWQPATLNIRYKKKPKHSWHVPVVTKCTMPITNLPPKEEIAAAVEKFMNAKTGVERAEEPADAVKKRAR